MTDDSLDADRPMPPLEPTGYLIELRDLMRANEPELWAFFASATQRQALVDEARAALLRSAYRLEADGHPSLMAAVALAAGRLGLDDPVTVYQAEDGGAGGSNATVVSLPGEAHVVFSGPLLELLDGTEVLAVLGHELAHHLLWTTGGTDHWLVDRLVHASAIDLSASPCHVETARLLRLHTELFADRGGLVATGGDLHATVAALVKTATGLRSVSGAAYLAQAAEVVAGGPEASTGVSHPENFVRAWALERWSEDGAEVDDEVADRLAGPMALDHLDLVAQHRATAATGALVRRFLSFPWASTDVLRGHARLFDVDPDARGRPGDDAPLSAPAPGLVDYVSYVLLDLATVDEEVEGPALAAAMLLAGEMDMAKRFDALVAKELGLAVKEVKVRRAAAPDVLAAAGR